MTSLTEARSQLVEALEAAGWPTEDHVPPAVSPPLVLIDSDEPYLEPADVYGKEFVVHLVLWAVFPRAAGQSFTEAVDSMITGVFGAVPSLWSIQQASKPVIATNLGGHPASRIRIATTVS